MSRKLLWIIPLVGLLLGSKTYQSALASPTPTIWTGSIGRHKVKACFGEHESVYYYLRYSKLIELLPSESAANSWDEGSVVRPSGTWNMNPVSGDRWAGEWVSPNGARHLRITLDRVEIRDGKHSDCYSFAPPGALKLKGVAITKGPKETFHGLSYRQLAAYGEAITTIQLIGQGKAGQTINAQLERDFEDQLGTYHDCVAAYEPGADGLPHDYSAWVEPLFWDQRWLSLRERDAGDCGGVHPFHEARYLTWDMRTANTINLWGWIKNRKSDRPVDDGEAAYLSEAAPKQLNRIIVDKALEKQITSDCADFIRENYFYHLYLAPNGLTFVPDYPHVLPGCAGDLEVSFSELEPFLSNEGAAALEGVKSGR